MKAIQKTVMACVPMTDKQLRQHILVNEINNTEPAIRARQRWLWLFSEWMKRNINLKNK